MIIILQQHCEKHGYLISAMPFIFYTVKVLKTCCNYIKYNLISFFITGNRLGEDSVPNLSLAARKDHARSSDKLPEKCRAK